jgi:apolipoprotein N-acyltransferase
MDKTTKIIHTACYAVSGLIVAIAVLGFVAHDPLSWVGEDGDEFGGTLSALLMAFEMSLFFGLEIIRRKYLPKPLLKYGVFVLKYMRMYHYPIGALACSVLAAHILQTWNPGKILQFNALTGLVCTVFLVMSLVTGVIYKLRRKIMTRLHVAFSFVSVFPFLLHLAD